MVFGKTASGKSTIINWLLGGQFYEEVEMRPEKLYCKKVSVKEKEQELISINDEVDEFSPTPLIKFAIS